jgi:hypothetical protein
MLRTARKGTDAVPLSTSPAEHVVAHPRHESQTPLCHTASISTSPKVCLLCAEGSSLEALILT